MSSTCSFIFIQIKVIFIRMVSHLDSEGCPIHPTRVHSSLVFAIWHTGNGFVNSIPSKRHELLPLLSIRHAGSRFAWDLENRVDLDFDGGLKMLSIRARIIRIDWSLWPRFKKEEGSCIVISWILTSGGLCRVGWKCCRFKSIRSNRHELYQSTEVCDHVLRWGRFMYRYFTDLDFRWAMQGGLKML